MTIEELKGFNGHEVTEEQFKEIEECDFTDEIEDCGLSPMYPTLNWFIVKLTNGEEINIFG